MLHTHADGGGGMQFRRVRIDECRARSLYQISGGGNLQIGTVRMDEHNPSLRTFFPNHPPTKAGFLCTDAIYPSPKQTGMRTLSEAPCKGVGELRFDYTGPEAGAHRDDAPHPCRRRRRHAHP